MTFLNAILLAGALAFAIPLLIHLLNRRRLKVVHWGAVHLLEQVVRERRRKPRVENLLLLLLRILVPIILALCLARPVLTKMSSFLGSQGTSAVILLDDSFSMGADKTDQRAKAAATGVLAQLPKGSDAHLILMGDGSAPLRDDPTSEPDMLAEELASEKDMGNAADIDRSLRDALGVFGNMQNAAREIVIVSDFQKRDWRPGEGARAAALADLAALPSPPEITLFPVGGTDANNLAIEDVQTSSIILVTGQEFLLRTNIRNHGTKARAAVPVSLLADGKTIETKTLRIGAGEAGQAIFRHAFDQPGPHALEIQAGDDDTPEDNSFFLVVDVRAEIGVVLADGAPSNRPLMGEADFAELALQPFASTGDGEMKDLIVTTKKPAGQLRRYQYEKGRVVVLANVEKLDGGQLGELRAWVHDQGGTVLTFPGDEVDINFYNQSLYEPNNAHGLFPCRIVALSRARNEGRPAGVQAGPYGHPALSYFNTPGTGDFSAVRFHTWYRLEVPEEQGDDTSKAANVLLRLDNGDPLLVERPYGKGRVIAAAVPCDAAWGNLPSQPVFLPLMQRLVTYLASSSAPPINLQVGEPIRCLPGPGWGGNQVTVIAPGGVEHRLEITDLEGQRVAQFTDTSQPGIYTVLSAEPGREATPQLFAANYGRAESDFTLLDALEIEAVAGEMGAKIVRGLDAYSALDRTRRLGLEVWRPVLYALLALLFLEILLQQYISRART